MPFNPTPCIIIENVGVAFVRYLNKNVVDPNPEGMKGL